MSKRYTLQEAAEFLEIDQSEIEDLIAEGKISFDVADDQYRIGEEPLKRIKVERVRNLTTDAKPKKSLIYDRDFIDYISDYIQFKFDDLTVKIEKLHNSDAARDEKAMKLIGAGFQDLKDIIIPLSEMKLDDEASLRLQIIMEEAVDRIIKEKKTEASGTAGPISESDIKSIADSIAKVLDEKISNHKEMMDTLRNFESKSTSGQEKILNSVEEIKKLFSSNGVDTKLKELLNQVNNEVTERLDSLSESREEIAENLRKIRNLKPGGDDGSFQQSEVMEILETIKSGQKKARKMMIDLNVNLQKSLITRMDEIKVLSEQTPGILSDFNKVIPTLKEISLDKINEISSINKAIGELQQGLKIEGQEKIVEKLDEIRNMLEKAGNEKLPAFIEEKLQETGKTIEQLITDTAGNQQKALSEKMDADKLPALIEEKLQETGRTIEQLIGKITGRQQKALLEKLDSVKISPESLDSITDRLQTIENTFPELSDILEDRFGSIDNAVLKVQKIQDDIRLISEKTSAMDTGGLDNRLVKIQEFLDSYQEKFDVKSNLQEFQSDIHEKLSDFKTNQESFQKIIVNLNRTNNSFIEEKLEHLDRLNELVLMKDNIDEIAEQMHTFEAIMADINQLVDERLQVLHEIQQNLGTISPKFGGEEAQTRLFEKVDEIRAIIDMFQDRFSMESLLAHMKNIIEQESEDLKQNQEAAQKILVNLNVNSQKWILEKLDELGGKLSADEFKEKLAELDKMIPALSGILDKKLDQLGGIQTQVQGLEAGAGLADTFTRIQKIIENETRSLKTSLENAQKLILNLGTTNQKILVEKLDNMELSKEAIAEITRKNQEVLTAVLDQIQPGNMAPMVDNLIASVNELKNNLNTDALIKKIDEMLESRSTAIKDTQENGTKALTNLSKSNFTKLYSKAEQLTTSLTELRSALDPESLVSSLGEAIIEGNEILKENQVELLKLEMKNHRELLDELKKVSALKGGIASAESTGELVPLVESMLNDSLSNFKKDLDGAHKVLVNLNINLQKQLVTKIQDLLSKQERTMQVKIDSASLVDTMDYLLDDKLNDIRENQESLLSINLNTQKAIIEKLSKISGGQSGESLTDELNSLLPLIEKILVDKLQAVVETHEKAQKALENLTIEAGNRMLAKLDQVTLDVTKSSSGQDLNSYLPAIREALEDTYTYLNQLRTDMESVKKNIQLQDPSFMGTKFEEIREFLTSPDMKLDGIPRIEQTVKESAREHREALNSLGEKLELLYQAVKHIYEERGDTEGMGKVQQLFSKKLEETQQLEVQLVRSFQEMQEIFNQGYTSAGGDSFVQDIVKALEETRSDQEQIARKIEQLSTLVQKVSGAEVPPEVKQPLPDTKIVEQMRKENSRLRQMTDKLKRENVELNGQLQQVYSRGGVDTGRLDQLQNAMGEKDSLLEECYKEKVILKDSLEKEKRDKYEIIQKYETEKKELIDTLALERIQREKDRAELELLRAESRKKKWW